MTLSAENPPVRKRPWLRWGAVLGTAIFLGLVSRIEVSGADWRTADRSSAGLAPLPEKESGPIVQVYGARTFNWRGYFAVHSWISVKEKDAGNYRVYQVVGWRLRRGLPAVSIEEDLPDRKWFGNEPELYLDLRGEAAEKTIPKIEEAVRAYPYPKAYRIWPGPNSNTFISHILRSVPELGVELPPTAIGRDWIGEGDLFGLSESGTGVQFSLFGILGMTMGLAEGIELNLFGLAFGADLLRPALKLPLVGRVGFKDGPVFGSP